MSFLSPSDFGQNTQSISSQIRNTPPIDPNTLPQTLHPSDWKKGIDPTVNMHPGTGSGELYENIYGPQPSLTSQILAQENGTNTFLILVAGGLALTAFYFYK
jgi:hypothetical protein